MLVCNRKCPADLISLSINGYDVILGMDWLSTYHVLMDCKTKNIKLCIPDEPVLECDCRKSKEALEMVSGEKAGKILRKGAVGFLAYIVNKPMDKDQLEQVSVVKEFVDVFPEELDTLPPDREIEFVIELLPGSAPISKSPYRMAPAELQELKTQLQE